MEEQYFHDDGLENMIDYDNNEDRDPTEEDIKDVKGYTRKIVSTTKTMVDSMTALIKLIRDAPEAMYGDECFNNTIQAACCLIGVTPAAQPTISGPPSSLSQAMLDIEWHTPGWQQDLLRMEETLNERDVLNNDFKPPSFSLGIT